MESRLTNSEVNKFGLYGFAQMLGIMVPMSYITIFMTENIMMSAALMGSILLVARIIDFIIAVLAGGIIEKSKFKNGKFRSWLIILRWTLLIGVFLEFANTTALPMAVSAAIVFVGYLLINGSMNFIATSQFGLISKMAGPSMEDRNRLSFRNAQFAAIGSIVISAAAIPSINLLTPAIGNTNAYTVVATLGALITFIGATIIINVSEPYDKTTVESKDAPKMPTVTLGDMVKSVVTNGQMLVVMLAQILYQTATQIAMGIMSFYFMFVLGDFTLMAVAMTITTAFGFVGSIIGPKVGSKVGKKYAMVLGMMAYAVMSLCIALFAKSSVILYIIFACGYTMGMYFFFSYGQLYFLDCGEYGLWKTGKDNRAVALSMGNLPIKIGMAVGGALGAYGLQLIGYTPGMQATAEFAEKFMWLFGGLPAVVALFGALIMLFGYKLTENDCERYARENAEKMAASSGAM